MFNHYPLHCRKYAKYFLYKNTKICFIFSGGVLFFIVAIIVSVCTVKICNRRKRRKQEQGKQTNKNKTKQTNKLTKVKEKLKSCQENGGVFRRKKGFIGIFLFKRKGVSKMFKINLNNM